MGFNKMKLSFTILMFFIVGCSNKKYDHDLHIYEVETKLAVPNELRDIGYDSIQFYRRDSSIKVNFCYPNNLRFKKDTIYTGDSAYKLFGFRIQVGEGVFLVTDKTMHKVMNGFIREDKLDSIQIDTFKIKVTKVKP